MVVLTVKERRLYTTDELTHRARPGEAEAFCPGCKAFQTVWFSGDKLTPTRKFIQEGSNIYHECGSSQPCRLYRGW